jgi:hypothetical protein
VTVLAGVGTPEAQGVVEEVVLSATRPLAVRRAAVHAFGRIPASPSPSNEGTPALGDRRLLELVEADTLPDTLDQAAAEVLHASPRADVRAAGLRLLPPPPGGTLLAQ